MKEGCTVPFRVTPWWYLRGTEQQNAVDCFVDYMANYTGSWFNALADPTPNWITPADLAAVTMLSVNVPRRVAIWLLTTPGRTVVHTLLEQIPVTPIANVTSAVLQTGAPAAELWNYLQTHAWPTGYVRANGVGRVIAGKLLAAKRPELIPILDDVIDAALGPPLHRFWLTMHQRFQDPTFVKALSAVRQSGLNALKNPPVAPSLLRTLDIVVWMRAYGCSKSTNPRLRALPPPP